MKQKCKSLFCALLCLVLMCATALPVWAATTAPAFGTDVSRYNGKGVDYTAWKKAGKTFTMIRMSYGNDHLDPQFWDNVNAAEAAGVPFGVYHYSYAFNTKEATIEANYVKRVLAQMKGKYKYFVLPVAYDLEDQKILNNSNKKTIIQHAITFCDAIRAAGYTPMVYANLNWFANYLDVQTLHSKGYKLWYANWQPKTTDFSAPVQIGKTGVYADIWQYAEGDMGAGVPDYNVLWDFEALAHVYSGKVIAQPTCTAKGVTRYTCSRCGDSYDEENIDALGHSYAKTIIGPTCTTQGYTAYVCTVCGEEEHRDKTPALGHQYKSQLTKATTAKDGQTYKKCTVCGAVTGKTVIAKASNIKLSQTAYTYNGKVQKPSVTVKDSKGKALKSTDYKIDYPKGMKNVGKYTVKVTLKGNYSGSKSMTYNINPKGTGVSKVTAAKKGFKVTWKKQATQTTGYQVQYSTSSKFKSAKTVTISKNKTTSKSVSKLSAKKKYYVRVRTYKTVKIGGKSVKLYSGWSKAKSVTTKK